MSINCTRCDFSASDQLEFNTHAFTKHFQCVVCWKVCDSTLDLLKHKKSVHHKNRTKDPIVAKPAHSCNYCSFTTEIKTDWELHLATNHETCWICNDKQRTENRLFNHLEKLHEYNVLRCKICDYRTLSEDSLKTHQNSHRDEQKKGDHSSKMTNKRYSNNDDKEDDIPFLSDDEEPPSSPPPKKSKMNSKRPTNTKDTIKGMSKKSKQVNDDTDSEQGDHEIPSLSDDEATPRSPPPKKSKMNSKRLANGKDTSKGMSKKSKQVTEDLDSEKIDESDHEIPSLSDDEEPPNSLPPKKSKMNSKRLANGKDTNKVVTKKSKHATEDPDSEQSDAGDDDIPSLSDDEEPPSSPPPKKTKVNSKHLTNTKFTEKDKANKSKQVANEQVPEKNRKSKLNAKPFGANSFNDPPYTNRTTKGINQSDFICDTCDFSSQDSKEYSRHIRQDHVGTDEKSYKCDKCNFSTFNKNSLIYHIEEDKCFPMPITNNGRSNGGKEFFRCDICDDFESISPFDIIDHLKEFHIQQPSRLNKMTPKQQKIGKNGCGEKIPIIRLERIQQNRHCTSFNY